MCNIVMQASGISKHYAGTAALQDVSLRFEQGKIYGMIGRNGAGKTTFIRVVTGLSYPDSGELMLFGKQGEQELVKQRKRIGCIIESPVLQANMTAEENLDLTRIARGIPNRERVREVLEMVGLTGTGKKKAKHFSLGMQQRLGIAAALLSDPELLILDEPMNGLDPVGIVEMRTILSSLAAERNITIVISSHILEELYQTATNFIIIDQGKILEEVTRPQLDERCKKHIFFVTDTTPRATTVLEGALQTRNYRVMPGSRILLYDYVNDVQRVMAALNQGNVNVLDFGITGDSLESYFINCIGGKVHA